jgi:hypothetical protein
MQVLEKDIESIEIYPKIIVYKNVFSNIDKIYSTLKTYDNNSNDGILSKWKQWSVFGKYLSPLLDNIQLVSLSNLEQIKTKTITQENQKELVVELITNFYRVTKDYSTRYGLNLFNDPEPKVKNNLGEYIPEWKQVEPSICKYSISEDRDFMQMRYHSDYVREKSSSPGYKTVITALAYFNDDYEGGEIDFCIGNKLLKYKPKAGDYIVFPSGHPEILTENGIVYLHGVMSSKKTNKYFARAYWQHFYPGSDDWFENENKYGKNLWKIMQAEIEEKFRQEHPQRDHVSEGIRIQ